MSSANLSIQHYSSENLLDLNFLSSNIHEKDKEKINIGNEGNMVKFKSFLNDLFDSGLKQ